MVSSCWFVVLLFSLFAGWTPAALPPPRAEVLTPEDSVYLDVLSIYAHAERAGVVLLSDSTAGPIRSPRDSTGLRVFGSLLDELPEDLVSRFEARAHERIALKGEVLLRYAPTIGPRQPAERELTEDEEGLFRLRNGVPATLLTFSRVEFDSARERALLHEYWGCGPRCGGTQLNLLRRGRDGRWQIEQSERGWIF